MSNGKSKPKGRLAGHLTLGRKARPRVRPSGKAPTKNRPLESVTDVIETGLAKGDRVVCIVLPKTKSMLLPYKGAELYVFK
jgi:hypothetical protein